MEPEYRFATKKAIDELAEELNLPNELSMQDWSYEVAKPEYIDIYISLYKLTINDDKKFVLIEMILQAIVEQPDNEQLLNYWNEIKPILMDEYKLHAYTIHYWANLSENDFANCKILNPLLNNVIALNKKK